MSNTIKIVSAVISLVLFLGSLAGVVWAFFMPHLGMGIVCAALAVAFGLFVRQDYYTYFQTKK